MEVNRLCTTALFAPTADALEALEQLEARLRTTTHRFTSVIHRRLGALARHPDLEVRCRAYRIRLLRGPTPDYSREMASFLHSGLPFLSEESIQSIVDSRVQRSRLDALRYRLHSYRTQLSWPANEATRKQLDGVFSLLESFVQHHPDYYAQVRAELVSWVLHRADPELAETARTYLNRLVGWFESYLDVTTTERAPEFWEGKIVFQDRIREEERARVRRALVGTTFLKQSIMLAFDERGVDASEIAPNGIWIAQVFSFLGNQVYRMSVNTVKGKHYDLLLATASDTEEASVLETTYWMLALGGRSESPPVVRQFGSYRPDLEVFSMAMVNDLTVWERVRELTSESFVEFHPDRRHWRNLFVRGMAAFFAGWQHSDRRIVPGPVSPANVVVPAPDFRDSATILSLAEIRPYTDPLSLVRQMLKNFYLPTVSYYPHVRPMLDIAWLFDAAVEALGATQGHAFLGELKAALEAERIPELDPGWEITERLEGFLHSLEEEYHRPLPLKCAVERYGVWAETNPRATARAREREIDELYRLYRLDAHGDLARYTLYRETYFAGFDGETGKAFDRLLKRMFRHFDEKPTHMIELSDLQATLADEGDRMVFSRMVFPTRRSSKPVDVRAIGDVERGYVVVTSEVKDRRGGVYTVREPTDPAEIGRLYRLYLDAGMPLSLADPARYLLAIDAEDRIVGGICFKLPEPEVAHMDGLVITPTLRGRGLGGELLEDFCTRMRSQGVGAINTHFISRPFLRAHRFQVDEEWGGLVRFLSPESEG
jgi:GNAT superfamily N-acetyltransferase